MNYGKISDEDWEKVKEYSLRSLNLLSDKDEFKANQVEREIVKEEFVNYLFELDKKYGPHPQIYDTIADNVSDSSEAMSWRLKAYEICGEKDYQEKILITESICQHYLFIHADIKKVEYWFEKMAWHCKESGIKEYAEYPIKLRQEIEETFPKDH